MKFPDPEPEHAHPSRERRLMNPGDVFLRSHRFKIFARPKEGGAFWSRDGHIYAQDAALTQIKEDIKALETP